MKVEAWKYNVVENYFANSKSVISVIFISIAINLYVKRRVPEKGGSCDPSTLPWLQPCWAWTWREKMTSGLNWNKLTSDLTCDVPTLTITLINLFENQKVKWLWYSLPIQMKSKRQYIPILKLKPLPFSKLCVFGSK